MMREQKHGSKCTFLWLTLQSGDYEVIYYGGFCFGEAEIWKEYRLSNNIKVIFLESV